MKIKHLILGSTLAITAGFALSAQAKPSKHIRLKEFNSIAINGGVSVILKYRPDRPPVLREAGRGTQNINVFVRQNTLTINAPGGRLRSKLPQVVVFLDNPLQSLSVKGIADVSGSDLSSRHLSIWAKGPGRIALAGDLRTSQIWQSSGGYVSLQGVRSKDLSIKLSQMATTRLQGKVKLLTARLHNSSTLEAEKLHARTVFIKTNNNAIARVYPINNLRAFAHGRSQILYYHSPRNMTEDARQSGNILQMDW